MSGELQRYDICYDNFHHNFVQIEKIYLGTDIVRGFKLESHNECIYYPDLKVNRTRLYVADVNHLYPCNKPKVDPAYLEMRNGKPDKITTKIRKMIEYAQQNNQKRLLKKCIKFMTNIGQRNLKGRIKIL